MFSCYNTFQKFFFILLAGLILSASPHLLHAQTSESNKPQYDVWGGNTSLMQTKNDNVKGSPYYNSEWVQGKVILNNDSITEELTLNYNIYEDKVIFRDEDVLRAYEPKEIKGFIILNENGNIQEQFANGFYDEDLDIAPSDLLRVVYKGDTKLLAKHEVFFSSNSSRDPFSNIKYSEFKNRVTYYVLTEQNGLKETKLKRKGFINALGSHQQDLKEYTKAANLKLKTEREALTLLYYFDSIK